MDPEQSLIEKLQKISYLLGEKVTDVADSVMQTSMEHQAETDSAMREMSGLAATISSLVFEIKARNELTQEEKSAFERVSSFAKNLGNAQYELNKIVKVSMVFNSIATRLTAMGFDFAELIVKLQEESRTMRQALKSIGYKFPESDLAALMDLTRE
jgi:flagellar motility protein MotE (MotC chaperone)